MSVEQWSGDMADFEAAIARCPFLNSLGESALAEIRTELEQTTITQAGVEESTVPVEKQSPKVLKVEPVIVPEFEDILVSRIATKPPEVLSPLVFPSGLEERLHQDIVDTQLTKIEISKNGQQKSEFIAPVLALPKTTKIEHIVMPATVTEHVISEPSSLQQEVPSGVERGSTPVLHKFEAAEMEMGADEVNEPFLQTEVLHVINTEITQAEVRPVEVSGAEQDNVTSEPEVGEPAVSEPELSITELLTEECTTIESGNRKDETGIAENIVPLFSERIETIIAEAVEPTQQPIAQKVFEEIQDLTLLLKSPEFTSDAEALEGELQEKVSELLELLGVPEPTEEQVKQFITRLRAEAIATEDHQTESYIDIGMREWLHGPLNTKVIYWHLLSLSLQGYLGRIALILN